MVARGSMDDAANRLFQTVIQGGYCIGCGVCTMLPHSPFEMVMDSKGCFQAAFVPGVEPRGGSARLLEACPFSESAPNEDELAGPRYRGGAQWDHRIGYYRALYAAHVAEGDYRVQGSSGGMASWMLAELMRTGQIDAAVHVREVNSCGSSHLLFHYGVSRSAEEIRAASKTRYYPVEMSGVLKEIRKMPGRYAILGLPCFIKAVRLLTQIDPLLNERVAFCISLVCGHLKSKRFSDFLGWQLGFAPGDVERINFRIKFESGSAGDYGVEIEGKRNSRTENACVRVLSLFGVDWAYGFFQYNACDYCDDVFGETADASIGDAWLEPYVRDPRGTNVLVVRSPGIEKLVGAAIRKKRLQALQLTVEQTARSQRGGLRHRRGGLAYRLYLKDRAKVWRPVKRVKPGWIHLSRRRREVFDLRMRMQMKSHRAFEEALKAGSFERFRCIMEGMISQYERAIQPSRVYRCCKALYIFACRLPRIFRKFFRHDSMN